YSTTVQTNLAENGANGIYKTTLPASGCPASWSLISTPLNGWPVGTGSGIPVYQTGGNPLGRIDLVMAPGNPSVIYAQVQAILPGVGGGLQRGGQMGLWRTTDGGTTWHEQSTAATLNADVCPNSLVGGDYPQNWYDQGIAVDPNNPTTLYMDTFEIWKSTDAGVSFSDTTCGYGSLNAPAQVHVDQHALAYLPGSSSTMLAGSDGGSYVTLTADQPQPVYNQLNSSLSTIEFYSGDLVANFANAAVQQANAGAQDNGSSVWNGDPSHLWSQRLGGDGFFARIEPLLGQRWYFESQNGGLNVSTSGPNGPLIAASGAWSSDRLSFIFPYEIYKNDCAPTGCDHLIAGSYRVWETTQGAVPASSWYINSPDLTKGTLADRSFINQLSYAVSLSTTAIVGTNDGNVQYGFGLGQGSANTATWVNVTGSNSVLPNRPILDVATDPLTPTSGYAAVGGFDENTPATPGHVFLVTCTANCATFTWANKTGNLPDIPVDTIIANPLYRQQVFAGTDWGVYYTNNIDAPTPQWFRFAAGMPSTMVWDFQIDRGFTTLAAFTRSRGAFVWPLPAGPFGGTPTPTVTGTPPTATMTSTPRPSNTPLPPVTPSATVSPTRTASPTATATPLGCGASQLLSEGFESGTLGVFTATTTIGAERWVVVSGTANSGIYSAFASDPNEQSDQQLALLTPLAIPAGAITATLHFAHRYSFEQPGYDGGVLESSTNGVVWTDAGANILQGGYTGVITATGGNPLSGRAAWINQSPGYPSFTGVTVNLLPYSGQSVQFRFRLGSDLNGVAPGWWVDDVSVIAGLPCGSATPTPPPRPTQTPGGPTATPQPTQTPGGPTATPAPPTASSTPCALSFTDVHPTDYFYTPVLYLACHGVISGYSNGDGTYSFRPYNNTTRSQMVKIVVLGFNKAIVTPAPGAYTFTDVPPSNPFFAVIETAARNNIVSGYTCGGPNEPCDSANRPYFRPYTNVTRGQLSKIDVVAAGWALRNPPAGSFTDVLPGTAFYEFVETAYCHGVISGYTCGGVGEPCDNQNRPYFRQYNQATRGQIAKIV
ncbi:MAG TPA: S-layer homology domain-containing protein, partial [Chloroflexia bacterium]|nr:S-layer homology domain-containing protein [Chloroflexia bacterium]